MHNYKREIEEALYIGNQLIQAIDETEDFLKVSANYGIWDLLGGKQFITFLKHTKINQANQKMEEVNILTQQFKNELKDIQTLVPDPLYIDQFLTFADFFFDGFLADYLVQDQIRQTQKELKEFKKDIVLIMKQLRSMQL